MTKILYLTENEELRSLCHKYWQWNENRNFRYTAKVLGNMYHLKTHTLHAIASKNAKYVSDIQCGTCGKLKLFSNRTEFNKFSHVGNWICESCNKIAYKTEQTKIEEYIRSSYSKNLYNIDDLNELALFFLALFLESISENCWNIGYKYSFNKNNLLTHSIEQDELIIKFLFEAGLIKLKLDQDKRQFHLKNDGSIRFDIKNTWFLLNIDRSQHGVIYHIIKSDVFIDKIKNNHIIKKMAMDMQLTMCIQKTMNIGSEYGFYIKEKDRLSSIINYGLSVHSMNNIYYFIWRSIRDAVVQSHKDGVFKIQAIRSIPIRINADIVRSVENDWDICKLKVPHDFSAFEYVLYNCIFSRSDYGFHVCIKKLFVC